MEKQIMEIMSQFGVLNWRDLSCLVSVSCQLDHIYYIPKFGFLFWDIAAEIFRYVNDILKQEIKKCVLC